MTRLRSQLAGVVAAIALLFAGSLASAEEFKDVPPLEQPQPADKMRDVKIRFVAYDGSTNGQMVVEVSNTGQTEQKFSAEGLYFVPKGDPEKAPQRLGAAGPIVIRKGKNEKTELDGIVIAPGEKKEVRLEVFCIDSHRSSPGPTTQFEIADERLPKELRKEISRGARQIIESNSGDVKRSKGDIQSHMWRTRDSKWVKLKGERKQEKAPRSSGPPSQRRMRIAPQRNVEAPNQSQGVSPTQQ